MSFFKLPALRAESLWILACLELSGLAAAGPLFQARAEDNRSTTIIKFATLAPEGSTANSTAPVVWSYGAGRLS